MNFALLRKPNRRTWSSMAIFAFWIALAASTVQGQCVANPASETAVGLKNASSYFINFYLDGVNKGGVPAGDRRGDVAVSPGEHTLRADVLINNQVISATRILNVPVGQACTWTVTDPPKTAVSTYLPEPILPATLSDPLKQQRIFITIAIPN